MIRDSAGNFGSSSFVDCYAYSRMAAYDSSVSIITHNQLNIVPLKFGVEVLRNTTGIELVDVEMDSNFVYLIGKASGEVEFLNCTTVSHDLPFMTLTTSEHFQQYCGNSIQLCVGFLRLD